MESRREEVCSRPVAFGRYRLVAYLGEGGMGDVYLAVALGPVGFSKLQVVKRLKERLAERPQFLEMFLDEARLAARLNHPNVVQTNEVGHVDRFHFIAMEYLDGQPLAEIFTRACEPTPGGEPSPESVDRLPLRLRLSIIVDALTGLHYAHELADYDGTPLGIVHRDATPHNVFVTYDGQTKIVDFGVAKAVTRQADSGVGVIKGKLSYMAPEQARCEEVDRRADIFSMGVLLWEMLSGRRLWGEVSETHLLYRLTTGDLPKLGDVRKDTPSELVEICQRAMAVDVTARYPTAAAFRDALLAYLAQNGGKAMPEEIGHAVGALFEDRRAAIAEIIETQLRLVGEEARPMPSLVADGNLPSLMRLPAARARRTGESTAATLSSVTSAPHVPARSQKPPPARLRGRVLASVALVTVAAIAVVLVQQRASAPPSTPAGAATTSARHEPAGQRSAEPAASARPPVAEPASAISVHVEASPENATLLLDDALLGTGSFTGRFPADGLSHRVRAEAPGHASVVRVVTFDRDLVVKLALKPEPAPRASATSAPARPRPTASGRKIDEVTPFLRAGAGGRYAADVVGPTRPSSAAFCVALALATAPVRAQDPDEARKAEARAQFQRGVELFKQRELRAARAAFERAYATFPRFEILYNLGQTCLELGDTPCAMRTFERYLADGQAAIPATRRADIDAEIAKLAGRVGKVRVTTEPPGAEVILDDAPQAERTPASVYALPGLHRVLVTLAGHAPARAEIEVVAGETRAVALQLAPPPPPPASASAVVAPVAPAPPLASAPAPPTSAESAPAARPAEPPRGPDRSVWIGVGVTGALAAGAVVTGLLALDARSDLRSLKAERGVSQSALDDADARRRGFALASDVLLVSTLLAGGVTLYLARRSGDGAHVSASVAPGFAEVRATFLAVGC